MKEIKDVGEMEMNAEHSIEKQETKPDPFLSNPYSAAFDESKNTSPESSERSEQIEKKDIDRDWSVTSSSLAEQKILTEMYENGELDYEPSQVGHSFVDTTNKHRINECVVIDMPYNSTYDPETFIEQCQMQEDGLNDMTVKEFLTNYRNYHGDPDHGIEKQGRSKEGSKAQKDYRMAVEETEKYEAQRDNAIETDDSITLPKLTPEQAERIKNETKGLAALHNPDQSAGGNGTEIHTAGAKSINSALGGLWRGRHEELYESIKGQIDKDTEGMSEEEKEQYYQSTYLHVRLNWHDRKDGL